MRVLFTSRVKAFLLPIFYGLLLAFVLRAFTFEIFNIPSGSMIPTLFIGDYLLVKKFSYGYSRYSLPFTMNFLSSGRIWYTEPRRGDVSVFRLPNDPSATYVKRIIGLPGDRGRDSGGSSRPQWRACPPRSPGCKPLPGGPRNVGHGCTLVFGGPTGRTAPLDLGDRRRYGAGRYHAGKDGSGGSILRSR